MTNKSELREKYLNGELFAVGDIVLDKDQRTVHEVVSLGTNYVSVVDANGITSKKWLTSIINAPSLEEDFLEMRRKRSSNNQIAFLGYKTKHFNENHYHLFHPLMKKYGKDHRFSVLSLIQSTDSLIKESQNININNYNKVLGLFERTERLLEKFNSLTVHQNEYRQEIQESLLYVELTEGLKFTRGDKKHAANLIANSIGVEGNGHPHEVVNRAAEHIIKNPKNDAYMATARRLFDYAKAMGIKWDHEKHLDKIK